MTAGKIYAIKSPQTTNVYYGSTIHSLNVRFSIHKSQYKKYVAGRIPYVCTSAKILQYDDAFIELIEEYECKTKEDLEKREKEYIQNNPCVNIQGKGATWTKQDHSEYRKDWLLKNPDYIKNYREKNAEKEKEYQKQYHKKHYKSKKIKNNTHLPPSDNQSVAPQPSVLPSIYLNTSLILMTYLLANVFHKFQNTSATHHPRK